MGRRQSWHRSCSRSDGLIRAARELPIRGVVVSRPPSSDVLGMTGAGGLTVIAGLPVGRVGVLFSVEGYKPLRCRREVRPGLADTVRAFLLPEDQVAVWNSTAFGCRKARP